VAEILNVLEGEGRGDIQREAWKRTTALSFGHGYVGRTAERSDFGVIVSEQAVENSSYQTNFSTVLA